MSTIQGDLFTEARRPKTPKTKAPSVAGSETSQAAAESIEPTAGTLRAQVLEFLRGRGLFGATDHEMQEALNMNPSTQRPRRNELNRQGLIQRVQMTRKTPSGRKAVVWVAR